MEKIVIKEESSKEFIELNVEVLKEFIRTNPDNYITTHTQICFFIVQRIYRRVVIGRHDFGGVKFKNNQIIDGHHRYLAYRLADYEFERLKGAKSFSDVCNHINQLNVDCENDWDMNDPAKRKYCTDDFLNDCV